MKQLESFFWGAIAALGALVVQFVILMIISTVQNPYGQQLTSLTYLATAWGIIGAAFVEELFKYIVIHKRIEYLSLEKTFVVNSLFVGFGFFAVELALLHFKGVNIFENAALLAQIGILHASTAGIIGYRIAVRNPKKTYTFISTILIVTAVHSAYNLLVNYPNALTGALIYCLLGLLVFITLRDFFRISAKLAG